MIYFVSTPIGNLKDISLRALEVLKSVEIIACEDTRTSLKLLNHYDIKAKLIAHHKFNERSSTKGIIDIAKENKDIAIISDAGTPLISDPGEILRNELEKNGIEFTVIPGANAILPALILSGMPANNFTFIGFLPDKKTERNEILRSVLPLKHSLVFYAPAHNLQKNLDNISEVLGSRKCAIVNEITKKFEKVIKITLGSTITFEPKGEYVLVVEGEKEKHEEQKSVQELIKVYLNLGYSQNEAIKLTAKDLNKPKSEVYKEVVCLNKK